MSEPTEPADDQQPLLVRPYVPEVPAPPERPGAAPAPPPVPAAAPAVNAAVALPDRHAAPARRRPILLVAVAAVAVALTAAGVALSHRDGAAGPPPAPAPAGPLMAETTAATRGGSPVYGTPAGKVPPAATASAAPTITTKRPAATTPPPSDRTVTVLSGTGDCLDLNGGVTNDGHHIQVSPCNGTSAQVWTFAADGTLRVKGVCAQETADTTVRVIDCASTDSTRWRLDKNQSIVNVASGRCLTVPGKGLATGNTLLTQPCDGQTAQRWAQR